MDRLKNFKKILINFFITALLAGIFYLFSSESAVSHAQEHVSHNRASAREHALSCRDYDTSTNSLFSQKRELTLHDIKNATYHNLYERWLPDQITLKDGKFSDTSGGGRPRLVMINRGEHGDGEERVAFEHLDGDENKDAAVVLLVNTGGTADFMILAALINQNGVPFHKASVDLGDRVIINSIKIEDRAIVVDMITHGPNDPAIHPTVKKVARFRLKGNKLEEIKHTP
jgi:hypothetical protein